jgi:hypothetical protein
LNIFNTLLINFKSIAYRNSTITKIWKWKEERVIINFWGFTRIFLK